MLQEDKKTTTNRTHNKMAERRQVDPTRSKREIDRIFEHAGYVSNFHQLNGDLCVKKPSFFRKIGWIYYYSLLDKK